MRWLKNKGICFLVLAFLVMRNGLTVSAAEEEYTYTVRLYAGNQGRLLGGGVDVSSESAGVSFTDGYLVIEGLKYGDTVYIRPQAAAEVTDERYYVRGVRRSGRDNSEAEAPTFRVASDRDYVMAYGIRGNMAAYTVHYVDGDGRTLMESDTYYGNIGERQYVSSRYIDGYQPRVLNMVKTLSANTEENVFTFEYERIAGPSGGGGGTGEETPAPAPGGGTDAGTGTVGEAAGGAGAADAGAGGAGAGGAAGAAGAGAGAAADAAGAEAAAEDAGAGTQVGGDVNIPDEDVPLDDGEDLRDLDDEDVPLADLRADQQWRMGYLPAYAGIGLAALILLAGAAVYLKKKHKNTASGK